MINRRIQRWLLIVFVGSWLILSTQPIKATSIPSPTQEFYVLDEAGVLSQSTLDTIVSVSSQLQSKTKAQLVVVIVDSLKGESITSFALSILRQWGIGDKDLDNGALILLALDDRLSRIEIGYGLEGALNDAKTGRIQDTYMLPYYDQGDIDAGILNGYIAIAKEIANEYQISLDVDNPTPYQAPFNFFTDVPLWVLILGALIIVILIGTLDLRFLNGGLTRLIFTLIFSSGRTFGSRGGGGYGGGGGSSRKW